MDERRDGNNDPRPESRASSSSKTTRPSSTSRSGSYSFLNSIETLATPPLYTFGSHPVNPIEALATTSTLASPAERVGDGPFMYLPGSSSSQARILKTKTTDSSKVVQAHEPTASKKSKISQSSQVNKATLNHQGQPSAKRASGTKPPMQASQKPSTSASTLKRNKPKPTRQRYEPAIIDTLPNDSMPISHLDATPPAVKAYRERYLPSIQTGSPTSRQSKANSGTTSTPSIGAASSASSPGQKFTVDARYEPMFSDHPSVTGAFQTPGAVPYNLTPSPPIFSEQEDGVYPGPPSSPSDNGHNVDDVPMITITEAISTPANEKASASVKPEVSPIRNVDGRDTRVSVGGEIQNTAKPTQSSNRANSQNLRVHNPRKQATATAAGENMNEVIDLTDSPPLDPIDSARSLSPFAQENPRSAAVPSFNPNQVIDLTLSPTPTPIQDLPGVSNLDGPVSPLALEPGNSRKFKAATQNHVQVQMPVFPQNHHPQFRNGRAPSLENLGRLLNEPAPAQSRRGPTKDFDSFANSTELSRSQAVGVNAPQSSSQSAARFIHKGVHHNQKLPGPSRSSAQADKVVDTVASADLNTPSKFNTPLKVNTASKVDKSSRVGSSSNVTTSAQTNKSFKGNTSKLDTFSRANTSSSVDKSYKTDTSSNVTTSAGIKSSKANTSKVDRSSKADTFSKVDISSRTAKSFGNNASSNVGTSSWVEASSKIDQSSKFNTSSMIDLSTKVNAPSKAAASSALNASFSVATSAKTKTKQVDKPVQIGTSSKAAAKPADTDAMEIDDEVQANDFARIDTSSNLAAQPADIDAMQVDDAMQIDEPMEANTSFNVVVDSNKLDAMQIDEPAKANVFSKATTNIYQVVDEPVEASTTSNPTAKSSKGKGKASAVDLDAGYDSDVSSVPSEPELDVIKRQTEANLTTREREQLYLDSVTGPMFPRGTYTPWMPGSIHPPQTMVTVEEMDAAKGAKCFGLTYALFCAVPRKVYDQMWLDEYDRPQISMDDGPIKRVRSVDTTIKRPAKADPNSSKLIHVVSHIEVSLLKIWMSVECMYMIMYTDIDGKYPPFIPSYVTNTSLTI